MAARGGMSFSNNFVVKFTNRKVYPRMPSDEDYFEMFCSEAQLPNTNSAKGTANGIHLGSGSVDYMHSRVYTDFQLGFMCDANMTSLKFLQDWVDYIFSGDSDEVGENKSGVQTKSQMQSPSKANKQENRPIRLNYRDNYACDIIITKTEIGGNSPTERASISYVMEQAYPFAIDAVPLQFGSSQITQVTAQFTYTRHHIIKNDIRQSANFIDSDFVPSAPILPPPPN